MAFILWFLLDLFSSPIPLLIFIRSIILTWFFVIFSFLVKSILSLFLHCWPPNSVPFSRLFRIRWRWHWSRLMNFFFVHFISRSWTRVWRGVRVFFLFLFIFFVRNYIFNVFLGIVYIIFFSKPGLCFRIFAWLSCFGKRTILNNRVFNFIWFLNYLFFI